MRKIKVLALFSFLLVISEAASSQEAIYLFNGTTYPFRLLEGDAEVVKMAELKGGRTIKRSLPRDDVGFIFNSKGSYLFMAEISSDPGESQTQLNLFYNSPPLKKGDILIKKDPLQVISGTIQYESPKVINYQTTSGGSGSVNKEELAAIVRSDGRHELFTTPEEAAFILSDALAELSKPEETRPTQSGQASAPIPDSFTKAPAKTGPDPVSSNNGNPLNLDEATLAGFRAKGLRKVEEFVQYLNIITDKQIPSDEKDKAIEQTLTLFLPSSTIQVTSANRAGTRTYNIRDYLIRLKLLPYSATEISWHEVNYIQELTQEADGAYYGLISGVQTFTGYGESTEDVAYSDVTQKEVRVKLQRYNKNVEGAGQLNWEVLLGNIGVSVTQ